MSEMPMQWTCDRCHHEWSAVKLPAAVREVVKELRELKCPKCASDNVKGCLQVGHSREE